MNITALTGYVVSEKIELRKAESGVPVTNFVLRVPRKKEDDVYKSDFIKISCTNGIAQTAYDKIVKGSFVEVNGCIRTGKRYPKEFEVYKNGEKIDDFYLPNFEIQAHCIKIIE